MPSSNSFPDLPVAWVDRIHARILVRYGAAWIRMWDGVDVALVKADWAHELAGMSRDGIAYGLDNLPADRPPTVAQFRVLCNSRPRNDNAIGMARPAPDAARLREAGEKARAATSSDAHRFEWVHNLRARKASGELMTAAQRDALKTMEYVE